MKSLIQKVLLIFLIILLCYVLYVKYIRKDIVVKLNGYSGLIVLTGSMEPVIKAGDFIIIKESEEYKEKEIVTFYDNGYLVTHRIVNIIGNEVITRGDFNNIEDGKINKDKILGKVVYSSEVIGKFIRIYIKYIFIIITIIVIVTNIGFNKMERKNNEGEIVPKNNK